MRCYDKWPIPKADAHQGDLCCRLMPSNVPELDAPKVRDYPRSTFKAQCLRL